MIAPKYMTPQQLDWLARMRANLEALHIQWYGFDGNQPVKRGMNPELFAETDRKIRAAAAHLNVVVENGNELAAENEGWDGELNGDLVALGMTLDAIIAAHNRKQTAIEIHRGIEKFYRGRR